jgi:hypothetical protein
MAVNIMPLLGRHPYSDVRKEVCADVRPSVQGFALDRDQERVFTNEFPDNQWYWVIKAVYLDGFQHKKSVADCIYPHHGGLASCMPEPYDLNYRDCNQQLNARSSEDPTVKEAVVKQMTTLSSDLLDFARRRSKVEAQLPYLDPTIPEGIGRHKIPAAQARDSYYADTRKMFRYEGHYFQRCRRIIDSLPEELRANNIASDDIDFMKRYCSSDAQSWPGNSADLENLSSLLLELAQKIQ